MSTPKPPDPFAGIREDVHARHRTYLSIVEPHRPDLFRYARGLTGSIWDAEDLVQEALMRVFRGLGTISGRVADLRAYLFRTVTNAWIDAGRRRTPEPVDLDDRPDDDGPPLGPEVREALERLVEGLPARERAAVLLREAFGFTAPETAAMLRTSAGAVKAALHRGRKRLASAGAAAGGGHAGGGRPVDPAVVDAFVRAFEARDVEALLALLAPDAEQEILGVYHDTGEGAARNVLVHTIEDPTLRSMSQEEVGGEPIAVIRYRRAADGPLAIGDALRFDTTDDGAVGRIRWYYFCPDSLRAIAADLGEPATTWGYVFGGE